MSVSQRTSEIMCLLIVSVLIMEVACKVVIMSDLIGEIMDTG